MSDADPKPEAAPEVEAAASPSEQAPATIPDARPVAQAEPAISAAQIIPASRAQAEAARRRDREQRERRIERIAVRWVFVVALGVALAALAYVNLAVDSQPAARPTPRPATGPGPRPKLSAPIYRAGGAQAPDLPALRALKDRGLTVVAEGLPEVRAEAAGRGRAAVAALTTCRFAYGIWEFSPNRRFRFLSTCGPLAGQVLVGAYELVGAELRMSPLKTQVGHFVSRFVVERPSTMHTEVQGPKGAPWLQVRQRINVIREGLFGDAYRDAYQPRNTVQIPGLSAPKSAAPSKPAAPSEPAADPLLELLR